MKINIIAAESIFALFICFNWVQDARAYPSSANCVGCHSDFSGGGASVGHSAHMGIGLGCTSCHGTVGDTPVMNTCAGCHSSPGLPLHHQNSGSASCTGCHPGTATPENSILPGYSGTTLNPCSGNEELYSSMTTSLDNDGDLLYDGNDPDCQPTPSSETSCTDGMDNDNNGLIDCADQNCKIHHMCLSQSPSKSNLLLSYLPVLISTTVRDVSHRSDAPSSHTDNEGGVLHKPGKDNPYRNGCTNCHGSTLQGGAGQSCYACHGEVWDVSGSVNGSGVPSNHTDNENGVFHKPGKDTPYRNGCTSCHGSILQGGSASSCYACHGNEWEDNGDD